MKQLKRAIAVLVTLAVAALMLAWNGRGSSNEQALEVSCVYHGGSCVLPEVFSGVYTRFFP
jgi:hypothetical protein